MITRIVFAAVLCAMASMVHGATDDFQTRALALINDQLPQDCPATLDRIDTVVSGNNGLRQEQWFVSTCMGGQEYWVSYYPPSAFPDRGVDMSVQRVADRSLSPPHDVPSASLPSTLRWSGLPDAYRTGATASMRNERQGEFNSTGMALIEEDLGPGCVVTKLERSSAMYGFNGFYGESWIVGTCRGLMKYAISRSPPDGHRYIEVQRTGFERTLRRYLNGRADDALMRGRSPEWLGIQRSRLPSWLSIPFNKASFPPRLD